MVNLANIAALLTHQLGTIGSVPHKLCNLKYWIVPAKNLVAIQNMLQNMFMCHVKNEDLDLSQSTTYTQSKTYNGHLSIDSLSN